jgi:hypothetical protein
MTRIYLTIGINLKIWMLAIVLNLPMESLFAQSDDSIYIRMDYMNLNDSNPKDYLDLELGIWKEIHAERIRQNVTVGWYLFSVVAGQECTPYDYITISVFDDYEKMQGYRFEEVIESVYPGIDMEELLQKTEKARNFIFSDTWRVEEMILQDHQELPIGEYITVNYLDSREGSGEHLNLELGFWKGIHQTRIEKNKLNSMGIYTLENPADETRNYNYGTIDFYDNPTQLRQSVGMELARNTYPDKSDTELQYYFDKTSDARLVYKLELWRLVDSLIPD